MNNEHKWHNIQKIKPPLDIPLFLKGNYDGNKFVICATIYLNNNWVGDEFLDLEQFCSCKHMGDWCTYEDVTHWAPMPEEENE